MRAGGGTRRGGRAAVAAIVGSALAVAVAALSTLLQVAAGPAAAAAAPAVAAGPISARVTSRQLDLSVGTVRTSTGKVLSLFATVETSAGAGGDGFTASLGTSTGSETHLWSFDITASALRLASSGSGSFRSASDGGRYVSLDVRFTPSGAVTKSDVCSTLAYSTERTEKMTGTLELHTGSASWGDVDAPFTVTAHDALTTTYGAPACAASVPACTAAVTWEYDDGSVLFGGSSADPASIYADRTVRLASPAGATREDEVLESAPRPVLKGSGDKATLRVATDAHGLAGSVTFSALGAPFAESQHCRADGKRSTQRGRSWGVAKATSGATRLRATEQAFGTIVLPQAGSDGEGSFSELAK